MVTLNLFSIKANALQIQFDSQKVLLWGGKILTAGYIFCTKRLYQTFCATKLLIMYQITLVFLFECGDSHGSSSLCTCELDLVQCISVMIYLEVISLTHLTHPLGYVISFGLLCAFHNFHSPCVPNHKTSCVPNHKTLHVDSTPGFSFISSRII